jgi:hypothetical protein
VLGNGGEVEDVGVARPVGGLDAAHAHHLVVLAADEEMAVEGRRRGLQLFDDARVAVALRVGEGGEQDVGGRVPGGRVGGVQGADVQFAIGAGVVDRVLLAGRGRFWTLLELRDVAAVLRPAQGKMKKRYLRGRLPRSWMTPPRVCPAAPGSRV